MDLNQKAYTIPEHIKYSVDDGEAVVLDLKTGKYLGLNPIATRMYLLLADCHSPAEVIRRMGQEYDVSEAVLREDLNRFLDQAAMAGIIEVT